MGEQVGDVVVLLDRPCVVCRGGTNIYTRFGSGGLLKKRQGASVLAVAHATQGLGSYFSGRTKVQNKISLAIFTDTQISSTENFIREYSKSDWTHRYRYLWVEQGDDCVRYAWVELDQPMLDLDSPSLEGLFGWALDSERGKHYFYDERPLYPVFQHIHFSAPVYMGEVKQGAPQALLEELLCG